MVQIRSLLAPQSCIRRPSVGGRQRPGVFDRYGANYGVNNATVNRIMLPNLYRDTYSACPIYHWVDDVEIWNGFPPVGNNPPYAPH